MSKLQITTLSFLAVLLCVLMPRQASAQFSGIKPEVIFYRHNSGPNGATPILSTDTVGTIWFNGLVAANTSRSGASIRSFVTGPVTSSSLPANLVFRTGANGQQNRMVVTSTGLVGIGTMAPAYHLDIVGNTHTSGNFYGRIHMDNNQTVNAAPNTYTNEAYFELKQRALLGVESVAGTTNYGGVLTLAPGSGANDHQLFFGDNGIYHRTWNGTATSWTGAAWNRLLTSADINGTKNRIAKFTANNALGDSQLWDDGTGVGIGTTTPLAGKILTVQGNSQLNGDLNVGGATGLNSLSVTNNTTTSTLNVSADGSVGGNLGVGTAATGYRLDVNGTAHIANRMAIGTTNMAGTHTLYVKGSILAEEVKVELEAAWPDYVFEQQTPNPKEWEKFIQENKHLPGIPSAAAIQANGGIELGETQRLLVEKIEQLTLMVIEQQKQIEALKAELKH